MIVEEGSNFMTRLNYTRFAKNFFLNNFTHDHVMRPLNAQIELTMRCNARCVFCSIWTKEYQQELESEMTTEEVKRIIDDLDKLGVFVLNFTGGEPTLRKDLPELITYASKKGMMVTLATNGFKLFELLQEGKLNDIEFIMVSLDWPDKRHDEFRGIPLFDKVIKGIRAAVLLRKKVLISTVITKQNFHVMEDMCKLAKSLGAMLELLPCEDIIRDMSNSSHKVDEINQFIPNLNRWANEILQLIPKYPNLTTDPTTVDIIRKGGFGHPGIPVRCHVAQAFVNIRYNGEMVFPCKIHPILRVNVSRQFHTDKIYHSGQVKKIILMRDGFHFCKGCRLGCAIVTSIPTKWSTLIQKYVRMFFNGNLF